SRIEQLSDNLLGAITMYLTAKDIVAGLLRTSSRFCASPETLVPWKQLYARDFPQHVLQPWMLDGGLGNMFGPVTLPHSVPRAHGAAAHRRETASTVHRAGGASDSCVHACWHHAGASEF